MGRHENEIAALENRIAELRELDAADAAGAGTGFDETAARKGLAVVAAVFAAVLVLAWWAMSASRPPGSLPVDSAIADPWAGMVDAQVTARDRLDMIIADPDRAKFRDVEAHVYGRSFAFCGEVNLPNGRGGYDGYQSFVATPDVALLSRAFGQFSAIAETACAGPAKPVGF